MGAAALMTAIIVLAIAVAVNVIMIQLDIEWDLTPNKIYTGPWYNGIQQSNGLIFNIIDF